MGMRMGERYTTAGRVMAAGAVVVALSALATGCRPESPTPTSSPSVTLDKPTPGPSVTPIETEKPQAGFDVPASCELIYSPEMLASLNAANPPLNDPGVTMLSTENADLLDIIEGGATTLRCSWGKPSQQGLATNVTAIDGEQEEAVVAALTQAGFGCEPLGDGTVCRIEQRGVSLDDQEYVRGETHYIGAGGLVTTAWLNFTPDGYTEDIVATLWG
jgi:hypothetical protein